jgi:hypothetical protein
VLTARIALVVGICAVTASLPYWRSGEETQIISYTAPKETPRKITAESPGKGEPARLWGAIVPLKSELWFFKLTGPVEAVTQQETALHAFLKTVRFEKNQPTWGLPAEWEQKPGNEFRYATLLIPSPEKPLELTVSRLPRGDEPLADQLLANINRWRGQVSQSPLKPEELASSVEEVEIGGVRASVVSLVGIAQANSMGRPPFAPR